MIRRARAEPAAGRFGGIAVKGMDRRLVGLLLLAVLARGAAVVALQSHRVPNSTYEHGEIAASLVAGRGFSMHFLGADGPTSQQAPVYPFLVAAAYAVGGVETPEALLILELAQAALGAVMVLGVFRLAALVAPERPAVAWWAAGVAALHPTLVYAATHVQVALPAATLVVWTLVWAARAAASGSPRAAAAVGLLLGLCALTDPILGLAVVGVLVTFWMAKSPTTSRGRSDEDIPSPLVGEGAPEGRMRGDATGGPWNAPPSSGLRPPSPTRGEGGILTRGGFSSPWKLATVTLGAAALTIAPWTARNALVHGEFVPIKSTFGYAFWQGNCAISQGTDKVVRASVEDAMAEAGRADGLAEYNRALWRARHTAGYIDDVAFTPEFKRHLGSLPEAERSRVLLRMAVADIKADPARYVGLCLKRFRYFWFFDETNPKSRVAIYRASHLGLTALALLGLATAGAGFRRRSLPLLATVAAISLFHALTIVSARFHVPIEPLLAVWAGGGAAWIAGAAARVVRGRSTEVVDGGVERVGVEGRFG